MARTAVLADTGFLVALLNLRDAHHEWAMSLLDSRPAPWKTCEAVLTETFHVLGPQGEHAVSRLLRSGALVPSFRFLELAEPVLKLMRRYSDLPMGFADACLVRMTEEDSGSVILTTDSDFRIYRRHGRLTVPCILPP
ncbi:MAG: PilT protein domain-containing [Planctomycetota bacterium]|nr:MAG: PilT protein domain-containing [Planctomycetota bacterium]